MTSSNGNIFRVTGHLCGEFTGPRWIPRTKASDAELWRFFFMCARINGWVNNGKAGDLRRHRARYDIIVMQMQSYGESSVFTTVTSHETHGVPNHRLCNSFFSWHQIKHQSSARGIHRWPMDYSCKGSVMRNGFSCRDVNGWPSLVFYHWN